MYQFSPLDEKSQLTPHEKARPVIRSFRSVLVLWFCICSNAFANKSASAIKLDHLIRMFLSACVDFDEKEKKANPGKSNQDESVEGDVFFIKTPNYYSLLNVKELVETYGSVRYVWEGEDEKFIKKLKHEISVLRHDTSHLKTILEKLLKTLVLDDLNKDNPLNKQTSGLRLINVKVYRPCDNYKDPVEMIDFLDFISGVIDDDGKMYICFEPIRSNGILLHEIQFEDETVVWILNLWYAKPRIAPCAKPMLIQSRAGLLKFNDHFLIMKQKGVVQCCYSGKATVICQSWKVRHNDGKFVVPMPSKQYLEFYTNI